MTNPADAETTVLATRCWRALEPLHAIGYFAPEPTRRYVDLGLHPRLSYFAARSAAFGPVEPAVTVATFYVFAPWLVAKALPGAWRVASPDQVQLARRTGVSEALHRLLGEPDVTEALGLAKVACEGLSAAGRPLYAAHSALDWPEDELLALWHAATLVREHRGDGHVSVLQSADLDPVESLVLGGLYSSNEEFVRSTRGWSAEEWAAAEDRLRDRGLLAGGGGLSDAGRALRQDIEDRTDVLATQGWHHLGADGCRRLAELAGPLCTKVLRDGELPGWIGART